MGVSPSHGYGVDGDEFDDGPGKADGSGLCRNLALNKHLDRLAQAVGSVDWVEVKRLPFARGIIDHHTLVYRYRAQAEEPEWKLVLDWGSEGLAYHESAESPRGEQVSLKGRRALHPQGFTELDLQDVRRHLYYLKDRTYSMAWWNCRHFCEHLYREAAEDPSSVDAIPPAAGGSWFASQSSRSLLEGDREYGHGEADGSGLCRNRALNSHLRSLAEEGVVIDWVEVRRLPFLGSTIDHHSLVYKYRVGGPAGAEQQLVIDWGSYGLSWVQTEVDAAGELLNSKGRRQLHPQGFPSLTPHDVRRQLYFLKDRSYSLTWWNCRHFSQHMFTEAGAEEE